MAHKGLWKHRPKETVGRQRSLAQRLREYQAMHEESFLSSWLREDVEYTKGERENMNKEAKEERENMEHRQKRECWKTEERCPGKTETCSGNTKQAAGGCGRYRRREGKMNKDAKEAKSKSGNREREGVEINIKRICPNRLSSKVFEVFCPASEMKGAGNSLDCSVRVPVVPPFVPVVTVPFLNVNVVCEVDFCDLDCDFVQPQTFSLSRKREACVASECETEMNIEGPLRQSCASSCQETTHAAQFTF